MKRDYAGLDLVRFFAAALVMIYHLSYWDWIQPGVVDSALYRKAFGAAFPVTSATWVGVPIFFVLSGFVISLSATGRTPSSFMVGRILRLYPGAWLCGIILIALAVYEGDFTGLLGRITRSMILWPVGPWLSGVYWTLAIEVSFYLVFCLSMALKSRDVGIRLAWLLTLSNLAYFVIRVADRLTGGHFAAALNFFQSPEGSLFLLSRGSYFALGISLWALSTHSWTRSVPALAACSLIMSSIQLLLEDFYLVETSGLPHWWMIGPLAIWFIAVGAQIYATSANNVFDRIPADLRNVVKILGLMTYPLYLLHAKVGNAVMLALTDMPPIMSLLMAIATLLVLCFVVVRAEAVVRRGLAYILHVRYRRRTQVSQLP